MLRNQQMDMLLLVNVSSNDSKSSVTEIPYMGKIWRGKILANLVNGWQFAKIFPTNVHKY